MLELLGELLGLLCDALDVLLEVVVVEAHHFVDRGQDHELVRDAEDELLLLQLLDVLLLVVQYRRPVLRVRAVLDQLRVERGVDQIFLRGSRRIRRLRLTPLAMRILRGRLAPLIEEIQLTSRTALLACSRL